MNRNVIDVGQDSFLDIVANLVGVLIILVVVVGAQAKSAWEDKTKAEAETRAPAELDLEKHAKAIQKLKSKIQKSSDVVSKLETDNALLEQQVSEEELITANMTDHRHAILMHTEAIRKNLDARHAELTGTQKAISEFQKQKTSLAFELDEIKKETDAIQVNYNQSINETINHYPNPIAETVFSEEVHFRLESGRLSYVPMDELIELMKAEWRVKAEKLQQSDQTRETVGPLQNFRMQYELEASSVNSTRESPARRSVQFKRFVIHPVDRLRGETIAEALNASNPRSQWQSVLGKYKPESTTVSIWVYPNSYSEHAKLKEWLHMNGFKMASWPLNKGRMISGGPEGFRTSAQ